MTGQLLQTTMDKFKKECPGLYERICNHMKVCFGLDDAEPDYTKLSFSEITTFLHYIELREHGGGERWSDYGSRDNLALRFYLAKTICELTPPEDKIPELYRKFASQLNDGDVIITFNWDCLLEVALKAINKKYTYLFGDYKDNVKIFKLHGSINWRLGETKTAKSVLNWVPFDFAKGMMKEEVFYSDQLLHFSEWNKFEPLRDEVRPLLVLPGFGKSIDVRPISPLWYKPEFYFGLTHDVFVIGVSLARDDFVIRSFFMDNLPYISGMKGVEGRKLFIINPDPTVKDNYGFLVGSEHATFLCEKFSDKHIDLMVKEKISSQLITA